MSHEPTDLLYNLAALYPGTAAQGIDTWLTAARTAGLDPRVAWRENGTDDDGLAVVDFPGVHDYRDASTTRVWTRIHRRYEIGTNRLTGITSVYEVRPSDGTQPWRYFPLWQGAPADLPTQYQENPPYLVTGEGLEDDHELYVLRTPGGDRRAGVVFGMDADFAAWTLGALHLDSYELDHYNLHGTLKKAEGAPQTSAQLDEGVRYWEQKGREWERRLAEPMTRKH